MRKAKTRAWTCWPHKSESHNGIEMFKFLVSKIREPWLWKVEFSFWMELTGCFSVFALWREDQRMRSSETLTLKGRVLFLDGADWVFQCFCSLERSWETGRDFSLLISYSAAVPVRLLHLWHNYCEHLRKLNLAQRQVNRNTNARNHTHAHYRLSHIQTHKIKVFAGTQKSKSFLLSNPGITLGSL